MMKINTAIVIYKKSHYQIYTADDQDKSVIKRLNDGGVGASGLKSSHARQAKAIAIVRKTLKKLNIKTVWRWRSETTTMPQADIVISVGGDGTVLDAARRIRDHTPVLGVNSDPTWSVGRLCAVAATELGGALGQLRQGVIVPKSIARLGFHVVDPGSRQIVSKMYGPYVNELLYAHPSPAATSRFHLDIGTKDLDEYRPADDAPLIRSSGLWVATAAGSSAAIKSAGGRLVALSNTRLQYVIREPYVPTHKQSEISNVLSNPRLKHVHVYPKIRAMINTNDAIYLTSRMRRARMWGDGFLIRRVFDFGNVLQISRHPRSLQLII